MTAGVWSTAVTWQDAAAYGEQKFQRFRDVLDLDETVLANGKFPITVGSQHFSRSDYIDESITNGFFPFDAELEANPGGLYADIGCGFRQMVFQNCLYIEVYPSKIADLIVEPSCVYPIKSGSLDGIGCFAVLEHARHPWIVVQEMQRMLRPGGRVYIDWPFLQPVHGYPSHFFNATREGLKSTFRDNGFEIETCATGRHQSPAFTVHWIAQILRRFPPGSLQNKFAAMTVAQMAALDPLSDQWEEFLGVLPDEVISEFACGNWLEAVKKGDAEISHADPSADSDEVARSFRDYVARSFRHHVARCSNDALADARRGLAEARRELEALRNSRSWRLTAPLRRLSTVLRRVG